MLNQKADKKPDFTINLNNNITPDSQDTDIIALSTLNTERETTENTKTTTDDAHRDDAETFLNILGNGDRGAREDFYYFDDRKEREPKSKYHARHENGTYKVCKDSIQKANNDGCGVYALVNIALNGGRKKEDIAHTRGFYADIDTPLKLEELKAKLHLQPTMIVETSAGKYQIYWLFPKPLSVSELPLEEFSACLKRLIAVYDADKACSDATRVLRLPGYLHQKGEPFRSKLILADNSVRYSPQEVMEGIPELPIEQTRPKETVKRFTTSQNNDAFPELNEIGITEFSHTIDIKKVISKNSKNLLNGIQKTDNRSAELSCFIKDVKGWEFWLMKRGIGIKESAASLAFEAINQLGIADRFDSIWKSNNGFWQPAVWKEAKDEGCWLKIQYADRKIYDALCPDEIKEKLDNRIIEKKIDHVFEDGSIIFLSEKDQISEKILNAFYSFRVEYSADVKICSKYLEDIHDLIVDGKNLAIQSGLGSGKTRAYIKFAIRMYKELGLGFVAILPRLLLLDNAAGRFLEELNEIFSESGITPKTINSLTSQETIDNLSNSDFKLVTLESLSKIKDVCKDNILVVDEGITVIEQALFIGASAIKKDKYFNAFKEVEAECKTAIFFDANLTDASLDFWQQLCSRPMHKVQNIYKKDPIKLTRLIAGEHDDNGDFKPKIRDKSVVISKLLESKKGYLISDSRKFIETVECQLRKDYNRKTFALTSTNSGQTWHEYLEHESMTEGMREDFLKNHPKMDLKGIWSREFTSNPTAFLEKYKNDFDIFLQSPSGSTGLSIDVCIEKHDFAFDVQVAYIVGVLNVPAVTQLLMRLRDTKVERFLFCPDYSTIARKTYESVEEIAELKAARVEIAELEAERTEALIEVGVSLPVAVEQAKWDVQSLLNRYGWREYTNAAEYIESVEKRHYWSLLRYMLERNGFEITERTAVIDDSLNKEYKKTQELRDEREAEGLKDALPIPKEEKKAFEDKEDEESRRRKNKTRIMRDFPGLCDSEVWVTEAIRDYIVKSDFWKRVQRDNQLINWEANQLISDWYEYMSIASGMPKESLFESEEKAKLTLMVKCGFLEVRNLVISGEKYSLSSEPIAAFIENVKSLPVTHKKIIGVPPTPSKKGIWSDDKKVMEFVTNLLTYIGIPTESNKGKKGFRTLNMDKFNNPFCQALRETGQTRFREFMKEGLFVPKEARIYALKNKDFHPDYKNLPVSLGGSEDAEDFEKQKPFKRHDAQKPAIVRIPTPEEETYTDLDKGSLVEIIIKNLNYKESTKHAEINLAHILEGRIADTYKANIDEIDTNYYWVSGKNLLKAVDNSVTVNLSSEQEQAIKDNLTLGQFKVWEGIKSKFEEKRQGVNELMSSISLALKDMDLKISKALRDREEQDKL